MLKSWRPIFLKSIKKEAVTASASQPVRERGSSSAANSAAQREASHGTCGTVESRDGPDGDRGRGAAPLEQLGNATANTGNGRCQVPLRQPRTAESDGGGDPAAARTPYSEPHPHSQPDFQHGGPGPFHRAAGRAYAGDYIKHRQTYHWKEVVPAMDDIRWRQLFRLPRPLFHALAVSLHDKLVTRPPPGLRTIEGRTLGVEKQLAICLNGLAQDSPLLMTSELFGVIKPTISRVFFKVVKAICEVHANKLQWPLGHERSRVMAQFADSKGLPNCLGALDCTHIHMVKPDSCASEKYYDRNGTFSLILMAVVDLDYKFLYVHVGCPGPYNDARVFRISALGTHTSTLFDGDAVQVQGRMVRPYVIADAGFALREQVIVPYPGVGLPAIQKDFNHRHSSARMCVEQTFGIFKAWWPYLGGNIDQPDVRRLTWVVRGLCDHAQHDEGCRSGLR